MPATAPNTSRSPGQSGPSSPPSAKPKPIARPDLTLPKNRRYLAIAPELHPNTLHLDRDRSIRYATEADLPYVLDLQNKHHDACGYTPPAPLLERICTRRLLLLLENGEPGGWISFTHRRDGVTHLPQMAVDQALWRTRAGTTLAQTLFQLAQRAGSHGLTLRSAIDLPANHFWPTLGMTPQAVTPGKRRTLVHWAVRWGETRTDRLVTPQSPGWHNWSHKKTGVPRLDRR